MIQFFATNRSMTDLAANVDRPTRLGLETGGYYFVDMSKYMAYYLREVERSTMPESAIVKNSNDLVFTNFLKRPEIGSIVLCVHGFNVELFEAFTWFRVLTETIKHGSQNRGRLVTGPQDIPASATAGSLAAFVGFSWPSNGNVFSYMSDQRDAVDSAGAFAGLLGRLRSTGKPVKLLCHSMGNYLACNALKKVLDKEASSHHLTGSLSKLLERTDQRRRDGTLDDERLVNTFVMIAPDIERRHIVKANGYVGPFHRGLEHLVGQVYNIYSRFDGVLNVSDFEKKPRDALLSIGDALSAVSLGLLDFLERNPDQKWEKRLGSAPHPPGAPPNVESINATEVAGRKIGHSDHIDCASLALRIATCLDL